MELAFDAMIGKTNEEIALRMKALYHDGSGFELDGRRFSVWFDPSGIKWPPEIVRGMPTMRRSYRGRMPQRASAS
ncbi:MAG: hypothetical protein ACLR4A_05865 [Christensenellales bacterium]